MKKSDGSLDGFELDGIDVDVVDYHANSSVVATRMGFKLEERIDKVKEKEGE